MTMTTYSLRFLEAFRLEEVPITKRKVFPEEKKMAESIKEGIQRGKFRFHLFKIFKTGRQKPNSKY